MVTRFIHIGDVHLQHGHPRNADRLQALDQIVEEGGAIAQVGAWLIPGDLFHQRSTADDRNALAERLRIMADRAPVVLVRGNHDQPGDLDIFARLKAAWPVYVQTRPGVLEVPLATGETAAIACLPYPDKSGLVGAGVAPGATSDTSVQVFDVIFMQLAHDLSLAEASGAIPLFVGHVNVRGSISSTGQPQIGAELELDRLALSRLPAVYCALNHIHRPQEVGPGVYAGSIAAMDHGEAEAKSYVVIEAERTASGWTATWAREPIATPRMFHCEGLLTREAFDWNLTGGDDPPTDGAAIDWTGCDVRVRYHYNASEKAALDEARVREPFAGALRLKVEGVAIADRELRAPEVAAAKTLPEKLAAYRKVAQLEPSVSQKLTLLQNADVAGVLADVALQLEEIESLQQRATVAA